MSIVNTVISEVDRCQSEPQNADSVVSSLEPVLDSLCDNDRNQVDTHLINLIESVRKIKRTKLLLRELVQELKQ